MSLIIIDADLQKQLTVSFFYRSLLYLVKSKKAASALFADILFHLKVQVPDEDPLVVLSLALSIVTPFIGLRSKKVAGSVYKIPLLLTPRKAAIMAVRFILRAAASRPLFLKAKAENLANELVDCFFSRGLAYTEKTKLYEEVERSRVFLKFLR